jgi:hypothetical protein
MVLAGLYSSAPASAQAAGCSDVTEQVRQQQAPTRSPLAPSLPDCRAYEQASPALKGGNDVYGSATQVQASQNGERISFFTVAPLPGTIGSAQVPSYLALRAPAESGWQTYGLEGLTDPGASEFPTAIVGDTTKALIELDDDEQGNPSCEPTVTMCTEASKSSLYLRDSVTGEFELLAYQPDPIHVHAGFADATPNGSQVLFETSAKLTEEAEPGSNLYEWNETAPAGERVTLAGVLPGGAAPAEGSSAGGGAYSNSISDEGTRVFFSDIATGLLYMREPGAKKTIQISGGKERAISQAATKDGAFVFYTEGAELYRFNVKRFEEGVKAKSEQEALAEAREPVTSGAKGVLGVLGISETNGSYIYFAAPGVLETNANGHGETAVEGANNVYEWHNGTTTFLVRLPDGELDWTRAPRPGLGDESIGPSGGQRSSRVTPDGTTLLFFSREKLTSYNNNGENEFYLYDAGKPLSPSNPTCVTCNPNGVIATGKPHLETSSNALSAKPIERTIVFTHNLSNDGKRVFFETGEALVPGDGNGATDVYEWEATGAGSCASEAQNGGCLYLISTGQSLQESYFGDASATGNDVFFFTRQRLATQDLDDNEDLYDARVNGGIPAQNPAPATSPCADESGCRGAASNATPTFAAAASTAFYGAGNLGEPQVLRQPVPHVKTRPEKLAKALKACRTKPKAKRKRCEKAARRRYGPAARRARKAGRRGGSR